MAIQFLSSLSVTGSVSLTSVSQDNSTYTGILVWDGSALKYRTKSQIRTDIGAGTGSGTMSNFSISDGSTLGSISQGSVLTFTGGTGITTAVSGSGSSGVVTFTNSDRGSSQNIFKNFTADSGSTTANINDDSLEVSGAGSVSTKIVGDQLIITGTTYNNYYVSGASFNTGTGVLTLNRTGLTALTVSLDGRYLTSNQTITLSGDVSGSGTTAISTTLATVNSNVGSFTNANITVNAKGLITAAASGSSGGITGSGSSGRVTFWNGNSSVTSDSAFTFTTSNGGRLQANNFILPNAGSLISLDSSGSARTLIKMDGSNNIEVSNAALASGSDTTVYFGDNFYLKGASEEMRVTDSLIYLGDSSNPALYVDTVNRKVGFRTTTPGSAFDVNGTFRARNELNIGATNEQNFFVEGGSGARYVKMGAYTSAGNFAGLSSSANLVRSTAGFGTSGKVVQASRFWTTKIEQGGWPTVAGLANGKALTPTPGANQVMYIRNIFVNKTGSAPGQNWSSGTYPIEFGWVSSNAASASRFIGGIPRAVIISTNPAEWWYQVTINAESNNPYGTPFGPVSNKPLMLNTPAVIRTTNQPTYYIQVEYTLVNITNFRTNIDQTYT